MKKIISSISSGLHYVAQAVIIIMMIVVTIDVFGRFFFRQPLKGSVEIVELSLALVVFFSLSYTHLVKDHISIDFIVERFSIKVQKMFDTAINLVITIVMLLVSWQLWSYSMRLFNSNTVTSDLGLPIFLFIIASAIGTLAFALISLLKVMQSLQQGDEKHGS